MQQLLEYALRSPAIRLLTCELRRFTKARFLSFCIVLLLLAGLASRELNQVKETSLKLQGASSAYLRFPANAIRLNDDSSFKSRSSRTNTSTEFSIQDIVLLPDEILLLIQLPNSGVGIVSHSLPPKDELTCMIDNMLPIPVTGLDYSRGRALVRCRLPPENAASITAGMLSVIGAILMNSSQMISNGAKHHYRVEANLLKGSGVVASQANTKTSAMHVKTWSFLVFEMWATEEDLVLFAKGINTKQGFNVSPGELVCLFGGDDADAEVIETKVSVSAQEVFRCAHPPAMLRRRIIGKRVTLRWGRKILPTVVYYEERSSLKNGTSALPLRRSQATTDQQQLTAAQATAPLTEICVCTMVFNVAKFLPEWGTFHSHVGVDHFIFYDNNSEDDLDEALRWLTDRHVEVTRYAWPWQKAQEAGFSHCVLAAQQSCEWVLFADVDEFLFPAAYLPPSGRRSPIRQLIDAADREAKRRLQQKRAVIAQVAGAVVQSVISDQRLLNATDAENTAGITRQERQRLTNGPAEANSSAAGGQNDGPPELGQISFFCRDFGPSNLTQHPTRGVTQGYVCRTTKQLRHKSLVKLSAVAHDLQNVVHHFNLLPEYSTLSKSARKAVVHHYKYQAWPEFRQKFRRRVSAYVIDWTEPHNMESRDRTPGLGIQDLKPTHWETSFCETLDTALRDYCNDTFAVNATTLTWQLS